MTGPNARLVAKVVRGESPHPLIVPGRLHPVVLHEDLVANRPVFFLAQAQLPHGGAEMVGPVLRLRTPPICQSAFSIKAARARDRFRYLICLAHEAAHHTHLHPLGLVQTRRQRRESVMSL